LIYDEPLAEAVNHRGTEAQRHRENKKLGWSSEGSTPRRATLLLVFSVPRCLCG
jgi:hypothetical protein